MSLPPKKDPSDSCLIGASLELFRTSTTPCWMKYIFFPISPSRTITSAHTRCKRDSEIKIHLQYIIFTWFANRITSIHKNSTMHTGGWSGSTLRKTRSFPNLQQSVRWKSSLPFLRSSTNRFTNELAKLFFEQFSLAQKLWVWWLISLWISGNCACLRKVSEEAKHFLMCKKWGT